MQCIENGDLKLKTNKQFLKFTPIVVMKIKVFFNLLFNYFITFIYLLKNILSIELKTKDIF